MKKVKKNVKKFDPPQLGFKPQILEQNFPAQDLNFEGRSIEVTVLKKSRLYFWCLITIRYDRADKVINYSKFLVLFTSYAPFYQKNLEDTIACLLLV